MKWWQGITGIFREFHTIWILRNSNGKKKEGNGITKRSTYCRNWKQIKIIWSEHRIILCHQLRIMSKKSINFQRNFMDIELSIPRLKMMSLGIWSTLDFNSWVRKWWNLPSGKVHRLKPKRNYWNYMLLRDKNNQKPWEERSRKDSSTRRSSNRC